MSSQTGFSADAIRGMIGDLKELGGLSTGDVRDALSNMMHFDMVKGDLFRDATRAAAEFGFTGLMSAGQAAQAFGRALESPANGMCALRQLGVYFSADQQTTIKNLASMGDTAAAQGLIMAEVSRQTQGLGAAMQATTAGQFGLLKRSLAEIGAGIGASILPPLLFAAQTAVSVVTAIKDAWASVPRRSRK